jgi:hypothetical protein
MMGRGAVMVKWGLGRFGALAMTGHVVIARSKSDEAIQKEGFISEEGC